MIPVTHTSSHLKLVSSIDQQCTAGAALLRKLADDLERDSAIGWRNRIMAATSFLLDGREADLDLEELRYLREVLAVPATALPVLER
jgi:hypothetical protein